MDNITKERREFFIQKLEEAIVRMKKTKLLAEDGSNFVWRNRVLRLARYHYKYILYLFSKVHPFSVSAKTFFGERIFFTLPEHYYFLMWGFFPEIDQSSETNLTKFLIKNLKTGDIFFDAGSNCGMYSLLARLFVGPNGQVHAFEPTPETFKLLTRNKRNFTNIHVNNLAVYSKNGNINFYLDEFGVANTIRIPPKGFKKITVDTVSIDEYCKDNSIHPTFLKIDVEGSEDEVILGAQNTLLKNNPLVSMEIWKEDNEVYRKAVQLMLEFGYKLNLINSKGELVPMALDLKNINLDPCFVNKGETQVYENVIFTKETF